VNSQRVAPLRVFVVDDDAVYRHILATAIDEIDGAELIGAATTLAGARQKIEAGNVDVVTLDVQLRGESGLDLLPWLETRFPRIVTVLLTAGLAREARQAVDALLLGASTLVLKPSGPRAREDLGEALRNVFRNIVVSRAQSIVATRPAAFVDDAAPREVIAVGASTGGPPVVLQFLKNLEPTFDVPVLVTQHMPTLHVPYFAELLGRASGRDVRLAVHGDVVERGGVYVAGDGKHLRVARAAGELIVVQDDGPVENQCRPAVDPLFRSVAEVCGEAAVGVVMSGMGVDGAQGALALRARGAPVIVQDRETSVVWGMPGAVVAAGAANEIVAADALAAAVLRRITGVKVRAMGNGRP
jgi:two-component system chemotaxis response regulator CheB